MLCGINLILLRGLGREAGHWLGFDELLKTACQARMPHVKFLLSTPDIAGCGSAYTQTTPFSLRAITDSLCDSLPAKQQGEWNLLVGLSMGGMIALDMAQRHGHRVDGVVLINSSSATQAVWYRVKPKAMLHAIYSLMVPWRLREKTMLRLVSNTNNPEVENHWLEIQQQRPVARRNLLAMLLAASGFRMQQSVRARGLVISSDGDRMVSQRCSTALAEQLHWPLKRHANAGHDLPLDDPEWLAGTIARWLAESFANEQNLRWPNG